MRSLLLIMILFVFSVPVLDCGGGEDAEDTPQETGDSAKDPKDMTDVVLTRLDGTKVSIGSYDRRILFVTFWASWNKDCQEIIPILKTIHHKYRKNVTVLAVSLDEGGASKVRSFLDDKDPIFEVFVDGQDAADRFGGARRLPTTYILLREGTIFHRIDGLKRQKVYEDIIIAMYKQKL